jgi:UDP-N-acetylglucosamine:LPS N-acetylglucosamine transferase
MTGSVSPFVEFFYFDAGGGHRSAVTALQQVIAERFPEWRVRAVNLQELLAPVDPVLLLNGKIKHKQKLQSGKSVKTEDVYNAMIRRGCTYGTGALLRVLQAWIKLLAPYMEDLLQQHWQNERPDIVVSLIPNFNRVMFRALRREHPDVPYVTVMTDIADYPPHFWQEKQDQFVICGSAEAVRQARAIGYRPESIFRVSGMILRPDFYRSEDKNRKEEREKLGLDPELPTALIMFGGNGSKVSKRIVKHMEDANIRMQSIAMCGRHKRLRENLSERGSCCAVEFTDKVPDYMHLADFFIGKPGPGSISEALHMGLPVIVERNKATLPQERYNTKWVEAHKVGIVVKHFKRKQTLKAIGFLLKNNTLEQFRENARRLNNRAVFEIPDILQQIMARSPTSILRPSHFIGVSRSQFRATGMWR